MALAWDCPVKALQRLWQLCSFSSPPGLCVLHRAQLWVERLASSPQHQLTPRVQTSSFAGSQTAQGAAPAAPGFSGKAAAASYRWSSLHSRHCSHVKLQQPSPETPLCLTKGGVLCQPWDFTSCRHKMTPLSARTPSPAARTNRGRAGTAHAAGNNPGKKSGAQLPAPAL